MTTKLAFVDERILACMEVACGISDGSIIARDSRDKQQAGGMQFGCVTSHPISLLTRAHGSCLRERLHSHLWRENQLQERLHPAACA